MRTRRSDVNTITPGLDILCGQVTLGTTGAIASTDDGPVRRGFTIAKTGSETGRYTITLQYPAKQILFVGATPIVADDAAYSNTAGFHCSVRDDDLTSDRTFEVQFHRNSDMADAEITDNFSFLLCIMVRTRDA